MKQYGHTSEEEDILASAKCREILNEILNFGVSQSQLVTLIKLMSLELEDRELMLRINRAINPDASIYKPAITV